MAKTTKKPFGKGPKGPKGPKGMPNKQKKGCK